MSDLYRVLVAHQVDLEGALTGSTPMEGHLPRGANGLGGEP